MPDEMEEFLRRAAEKRRPQGRSARDAPLEAEIIDVVAVSRAERGGGSKMAQEQRARREEAEQAKHTARRPALAPIERNLQSEGLDNITRGNISLAADLVQMLRDPQTLRQAIVLSEILQRPDHRW